VAQRGLAGAGERSRPGNGPGKKVKGSQGDRYPNETGLREGIGPSVLGWENRVRGVGQVGNLVVRGLAKKKKKGVGDRAEKKKCLSGKRRWGRLKGRAGTPVSESKRGIPCGMELKAVGGRGGLPFSFDILNGTSRDGKQKVEGVELPVKGGFGCWGGNQTESYTGPFNVLPKR